MYMILCHSNLSSVWLLIVGCRTSLRFKLSLPLSAYRALLSFLHVAVGVPEKSFHWWGPWSIFCIKIYSIPTGLLDSGPKKNIFIKHLLVFLFLGVHGSNFRNQTLSAASSTWQFSQLLNLSEDNNKNRNVYFWKLLKNGWTLMVSPILETMRPWPGPTL